MIQWSQPNRQINDELVEMLLKYDSNLLERLQIIICVIFADEPYDAKGYDILYSIYTSESSLIVRILYTVQLNYIRLVIYRLSLSKNNHFL